jgi:hypothetical protein
VRNLKVRDFSAGLDTISFDILWYIAIQVRTQMTACRACISI